MLTVKGKVIDSKTGEPLELANAVVSDGAGKPFPVNGNIIARQSDAKGEFILPFAHEDTFLRVSYVGYKPLLVSAKEAAKMGSFSLSQGDALNEVVIVAKKGKKDNTGLWIIGGIALLGIVVVTIVVIATRK
jgi:hypothetical protein